YRHTARRAVADARGAATNGVARDVSEPTRAARIPALVVDRELVRWGAVRRDDPTEEVDAVGGRVDRDRATTRLPLLELSALPLGSGDGATLRAFDLECEGVIRAVALTVDAEARRAVAVLAAGLGGRTPRAPQPTAVHVRLEAVLRA